VEERRPTAATAAVAAAAAAALMSDVMDSMDADGQKEVVSDEGTRCGRWARKECPKPTSTKSSSEYQKGLASDCEG
jgi:hypothetical protein